MRGRSGTLPEAKCVDFRLLTSIFLSLFMDVVGVTCVVVALTPALMSVWLFRLR